MGDGRVACSHQVANKALPLSNPCPVSIHARRVPGLGKLRQDFAVHALEARGTHAVGPGVAASRQLQDSAGHGVATRQSGTGQAWAASRVDGHAPSSSVERKKPLTPQKRRQGSGYIRRRSEWRPCGRSLQWPHRCKQRSRCWSRHRQRVASPSCRSLR